MPQFLVENVIAASCDESSVMGESLQALIGIRTRLPTHLFFQQLCSWFIPFLMCLFCYFVCIMLKHFQKCLIANVYGSKPLKTNLVLMNISQGGLDCPELVSEGRKGPIVLYRILIVQHSPPRSGLEPLKNTPILVLLIGLGFEGQKSPDGVSGGSHE